MKKKIEIGTREIYLSNSVAWTMEYREQFGKDIVPTLMPMLMALFEGIAAVFGDKEEITLPDVNQALASLQGRSQDILMPLFQLEFVDIVNITWAMAKAADPGIKPPIDWARDFDIFPVDIVVPAIYEMILKGFVSSKNQERLEAIAKSLKALQPSLSTTSSLQESSED